MVVCISGVGAAISAASRSWGLASSISVSLSLSLSSCVRVQIWLTSFSALPCVLACIFRRGKCHVRGLMCYHADVYIMTLDMVNIWKYLRVIVNQFVH
jgi:hypothetical protein